MLRTPFSLFTIKKALIGCGLHYYPSSLTPAVPPSHLPLQRQSFLLVLVHCSYLYSYHQDFVLLIFGPEYFFPGYHIGLLTHILNYCLNVIFLGFIPYIPYLKSQPFSLLFLHSSFIIYPLPCRNMHLSCLFVALLSSHFNGNSRSLPAFVYCVVYCISKSNEPGTQKAGLRGSFNPGRFYLSLAKTF